MKVSHIPLDKCLILVVDDVPTNIRLINSMLQKEGYPTATAADGYEAIKIAKEKQPDLILLDLMMPGMDGIETASKIHELQGEEVPIIFLTASNEKTHVVDAFEVGAVDYVIKPFNKHELLARVRTHLEIKILRDKLEAHAADLEKSLERIANLEDGILHLCAWTKQVKVNDEWMPIDQYLAESLGMRISHGMSDEAMAKMEKRMEKMKEEGKFPNSNISES